MAGYVIHIAIGQEYLKKHKEIKEDYEEFIKGVVAPDFVIPKSKSHYGKSPAYTNLKEFLNNNDINNSFNRGQFLHLITDYLFYNYYLDTFSNEYIYNDYDILNEQLIKKYDIKLIDSIKDAVKDFVLFKEGETKILSIELANKLIEEISDLNIDNVVKEVNNNDLKWNIYKNIV